MVKGVRRAKHGNRPFLALRSCKLTLDISSHMLKLKGREITSQDIVNIRKDTVLFSDDRQLRLQSLLQQCTSVLNRRGSTCFQLASKSSPPLMRSMITYRNRLSCHVLPISPHEDVLFLLSSDICLRSVQHSCCQVEPILRLGRKCATLCKAGCLPINSSASCSWALPHFLKHLTFEPK